METKYLFALTGIWQFDQTKTFIIHNFNPAKTLQTLQRHALPTDCQHFPAEGFDFSTLQDLSTLQPMPSIYLIFSSVCIYYNDYEEVLNHPKPFTPEGFERSE